MIWRTHNGEEQKEGQEKKKWKRDIRGKAVTRREKDENMKSKWGGTNGREVRSMNARVKYVHYLGLRLP